MCPYMFSKKKEKQLHCIFKINLGEDAKLWANVKF